MNSIFQKNYTQKIINKIIRNQALFKEMINLNNNNFI